WTTPPPPPLDRAANATPLPRRSFRFFVLRDCCVSGDVDCEVILVKAIVDLELNQLERKACSLVEEWLASEAHGCVVVK
ncbi:hypothetical protein VIGAN_03108300, partial [Vigna angularis var. angularis]